MTEKIIDNRYRVIELLGSGGMAHVYKAKDIIADRIVAVKVLKDENKDDLEFVRRFEREASAVLTLSHPNIVKSYDVGVDGDMHYLVLEYVEGKTLKEIITAEKTLSPKQSINIVSQVLDALTHAHECGIIHRDIKPQNVIITPKGKVKLTDFGIARDTASTTRTFAGSNMIGSVHFLSPEQAKGEEVMAESDIYSTGIMLYEMLTGTVPFSGDNSVAIALKHLQEEITPPAQVNSKIPRALSDIIVKAASKRPEDRYASAALMKADLQRALREPYGKFARVKNEQEAEKKSAINKLSVGAIALVVLLVLGLLFIMLFLAGSLLNNGNSTFNSNVVPSFIGKTLEEAENLAESSGYVLYPQYEPNEVVPKDEITFQVPSKGSKLEPGGTVTVTVSSGNDYPMVPNLFGMTSKQAKIELEAAGLRLGDVNYDTESQLPPGTITKQSPRSDEQAMADDEVDIWISGNGENAVQMPKLIGETYENAVATVLESGFERVWIRAMDSTDNSSYLPETIIMQTPLTDASTTKDILVEMWVYRTYLGGYRADISFNVDITEKKSTVVVTAVLENGAELVIYEGQASKGERQPVSFTANMLESGEHVCILYIDGVEIRRSTHMFSFK